MVTFQAAISTDAQGVADLLQQRFSALQRLLEG